MRYEVLPAVNCQLRGFDDNVDVFSQRTDNSQQEALRTSWRMDITSYEDRSDPESLRIEITEKKIIIPLFEDSESELTFD
jgi:hypothetical protein